MSLDAMAEHFECHPSTVGYHLQKHGLVPVGHQKHAPNGKVDPDYLTDLIEEGATLREAGELLGVSYSTVRHWVKKLELETLRSKRLRESRAAIDDGVARPVLNCSKHGEVPFNRRPDGNFRCSKCQSQAVTDWRRRLKLKLIERAGGCCQICSYNRCAGALHFHHLDPSKKRFQLSRHGVTRSFEEAAAEADTCVLLCANCHAEVETGVTPLATPIPAATVAIEATIQG